MSETARDEHARSPLQPSQCRARYAGHRCGLSAGHGGRHRTAAQNDSPGRFVDVTFEWMPKPKGWKPSIGERR